MKLINLTLSSTLLFTFLLFKLQANANQQDNILFKQFNSYTRMQELLYENLRIRTDADALFMQELVKNFGHQRPPLFSRESSSQNLSVSTWIIREKNQRVALGFKDNQLWINGKAIAQKTEQPLKEQISEVETVLRNQKKSAFLSWFMPQTFAVEDNLLSNTFDLFSKLAATVVSTMQAKSEQTLFEKNFAAAPDCDTQKEALKQILIDNKLMLKHLHCHNQPGLPESSPRGNKGGAEFWDEEDIEYTLVNYDDPQNMRQKLFVKKVGGSRPDLPLTNFRFNEKGEPVYVRVDTQGYSQQTATHPNSFFAKSVRGFEKQYRFAEYLARNTTCAKCPQSFFNQLRTKKGQMLTQSLKPANSTTSGKDSRQQ